MESEAEGESNKEGVKQMNYDILSLLNGTGGKSWKGLLRRSKILNPEIFTQKKKKKCLRLKDSI